LLFSRAITRVITREKQREQLGGGAIADGETRAKNASGNGPLSLFYCSVISLVYVCKFVLMRPVLPLVHSGFVARRRQRRRMGKTGKQQLHAFTQGLTVDVTATADDVDDGFSENERSKVI
jgi:hypothetical protein